MIYKIRVGQKDSVVDIRGGGVKSEAERTLGIKNLESVKTAKVYRLEGIKEAEAKKLAKNLFCEEINQKFTLNTPLLNGAKHVIEVAYQPGVMNPEVASILKSAKDLEINLKAADSSTEYAFYGKIKPQEIEEIVKKILVNKTVERVVYDEPKTLLIAGKVGPIEPVFVRDATDEELANLSKDKLFLNLEEMQVIQNYFQKLGRDPTDCELEIIAAWWSEHCGHKTFKAKIITENGGKPPLIERIKKTAQKYFGNLVVSAFVDNSGVMKFYDGMAICGKVETHNSPSAIEPYGGAMTGSGGVFRDTLGTGQGAKVVISTDMFCFAPPKMSEKKLPAGCLNPDYLLRRVVSGVRDYGNRMGIPTNNGSVHFHDDFRAKPTVIVGSYGIIPVARAKKGAPKPGDLVVLVGGRTGRDGIHGATFSSGEMTERTINVNATAVQIGNAVEEKRMLDAILEARDKNLVRAITDCGAAGLSSAVGELGKETGVEVDISKVPLKYPGLSPWEIFLSEAQERMVLAVSPKNIKRFLEITKKFNVEATILGKFNRSRKLRVNYGKQKIAELEYRFLENGLPQRVMKAVDPPCHSEAEGRRMPMGSFASAQDDSKKMDQDDRVGRGGIPPKTEKEWIKVLKKVLSHGNVCSKEPIVRQYDHGVQGSNALPPFGGKNYDGPNDAVVISPILGKPYGMVKSHGLNPILNRIDPYWGSVWVVTEAVANYVAVGGDYRQACLINNYIWPTPDEESMWSLDCSVDAVVDMMRVLKRPVISGKDSLSLTYRASRQAGRGKNGEVLKIPPVLCLSVFGRIADARKTVSSDIKKESSVLCLVGKLDKKMGGSTYYDVSGLLGNEVPRVGFKLLPKVFKTIHRGIAGGKILACHDVSEGGIITTVLEMCFGGDCGVEINLKLNGVRPEMFLFNETAGCFVIEVENKKTADRLFKNIPYIILGKAKPERKIRVNFKNKTLFDVSIDELKRAWQKPMKKIFP